MEIKSFNFSNAGVRNGVGLRNIGNIGRFTGYASIFFVRDSYGDVVMPGAFKRSIANFLSSGNNIKLLWQHNSSEPIGMIDIIKEDNRGLYVGGQLFLELQKAREAYLLIKRGVISGLSIGYTVNSSTLDRTSNTRKLMDLNLMEISLVTFPANHRT